MLSGGGIYYSSRSSIHINMARIRRDWRKLVLIIFGLAVIISAGIGSKYFGLNIGRFFAAEPDGLSEGGFVRVCGTKLCLNGRHWFSKGANWISAKYPTTDWLAGLNAAAAPAWFLSPEGWDPVKLDKELFQLHEMLDINTLRMAGPVGVDENGTWLPGYEQRVIDFVRLAYKNGMRINWTLFFGVPGFTCPNEKGEHVPCNVQGRPDIGEAVLMPPGSERSIKTLAQVRSFVSSLKNEPGVLSYEVGNEMVLNGTVRAVGYQEQMLSYVKQILDEVRRNDSKHFTVSGEIAVIEGPNDNRWPWLEGKGVEFVRFADVHHLNQNAPFSLEDVVDVIGSHMYQPPEKVKTSVDVILAATRKPVLFGEYGGGGNSQGHIALPDPVEQGRWHRAMLAEARARLSGAWVWNPAPTVDLKPGTFRIETWPSNSGLRPIIVFNGPPEKRLRLLSMAHWILSYQTNALNSFAMTPASLALANRRATFISQNVPTTMQASRQYQVTMTWRNDGDGSWDFAGGHGNYGYAFRIKSVNPYDNLNFGVNFVPLQQVPVRPGQIATFTFTVTAPSKPGTYNFQWQMNQGLVGWFGDKSLNIAVKVVAPPPPTITAAPASRK